MVRPNRTTMGSLLLCFSLVSFSPVSLASNGVDSFPPSYYYHSGDLYFQYYGSLYHLPTGFSAGDWTTAARSTVIVTWEADGSNNTGKFDNNYVGYTGPVRDEGNPQHSLHHWETYPTLHVLQLDTTQRLPGTRACHGQSIAPSQFVHS